MRKALAVALMLGLINAPLLEAAASVRSGPTASAAPQESWSYEPYSPEQLDNLLAPIALYPDPLLAQVFVAATFPDEVEEAGRYTRANGEEGVDDQDWDVSVRAVAHYPT